jgi:hypothetical protein
MLLWACEAITGMVLTSQSAAGGDYLDGFLHDAAGMVSVEGIQGLVPVNGYRSTVWVWWVCYFFTYLKIRWTSGSNTLMIAPQSLQMMALSSVLSSSLIVLFVNCVPGHLGQVGCIQFLSMFQFQCSIRNHQGKNTDDQ